MKLWFFASILAGTLLTAEEFIFIILTCGPFWLGPVVFFETWLIYCLFSLIVSYVVRLILSSIPSLRTWYKDAAKRLLIDLVSVWLIGSAVMVIAIVSDLDYGVQHWIFLGVVFCVGATTLVLFLKDAKKPKLLSLHLISLILFLIALSHAVLLISDAYFARAVKIRNESYNGTVPHVSLIILDTVRGDHLSCNGYPYRTTPNLDAIADEGLLCKNAFSSTNWTPPGHISIFTGKYPSQHGNNGQPYMPDELVSLTEILREEGYFCVAMYSNPLAGENINLTQGFDSDIGVHTGKWVHPLWMKLVDKFKYRDHGSRVTFSMAIATFKWIQRKGGHLFIYLNLLEPHASYVRHEPFFSKCTESLRLSAIPNLPEVDKLCRYGGEINYDSTYFKNYNEASYQYLRAAYDSEIAYVDHYFGRFCDGLKYQGLFNNTLVVVTSDHGESLGEHFTRGHHSVLFNPVIRIPLIIRYLQRITPTVLDNYVSNVDILPTVLHLMGYSNLIPEDVEGMNLLNSRLLQDRLIISEDYNPTIKNLESDWVCYSLIKGSSKLMLSMNTDSAFFRKFPFDTLLMNIETDPAELIDLHSLQPNKTDSMVALVNEWVERIHVVPEIDITISDDAADALMALDYVH